VQVEDLNELLSPAGQEALEVAVRLEPREVDFLSHLQALSRQYPRQLAAAALEIAILRREARAKFPFAGQLYFEREALEQASSYEISTYRAERYRGYTILADLGCSLGADTLALAGVAPTLGIDRDPLRLRLAGANLSALGLDERASLLQADLNHPLPFSPQAGMALFFDPGRRTNGRRAHSVRRYQPPLRVIDSWLPRFPDLGVKISPGVDLDEIQGYDCEVEFISLRGELKEAVLWFGALKSAARRATLLPGGHTLATMEDERKLGLEQGLPISEPSAYLYEPDPAILRAGLVRPLGEQLLACQMDADIAYLTGDPYQPTPFARAWLVEAWMPFNLKRLRGYLRERGVGQVVVKKRGSPLEPEMLSRKLRLQGEEKRTLFLTHLRGEHIVVVAGGEVLREKE
jgi:hypothetical protein